MGEQFEYVVHQVPLTGASAALNAERHMNALGALGWEMVGFAGVDKTIGLNAVMAVFRRRLPPLPEPTGAPESWQPDPLGRHEYRWWDGFRWTQKVSDQGRQSDDWPTPLPG